MLECCQYGANSCVVKPGNAGRYAQVLDYIAHYWLVVIRYVWILGMAWMRKMWCMI